MITRLGIYLELKNTSKVDFSMATKGNPGVGGTAYLEVLIATYLKEMYSEYEIIIYTENEQIFPKQLLQKIVLNDIDAVCKAKQDCVDMFIFVAKNNSKNFYSLIDEYDICTIAWIHNFIDYKTLDQLFYTRNIRRAVFVGQQHYDTYIDDKIINKSSYIYNIVNANLSFEKERISKEKIVTYVGALIKPKGFAILAKSWKKVIKSVPEAKLYVIGSGKLYDRFTKMGQYGLAEYRFEKKFMKYLTDRNGKVIESVKFLGMLGNEKEEIYKKTSVGVANPGGKTETFCLSAVEFELHGIPVVTYNGFGLLDTVKNGHTGFLSRTSKGISKHIIFLLKNSRESLEMGNCGEQYAKERFSPSIIIPKWHETIDEVLRGEKTKIMFSYSNYLDDWKWLKYINFRIKNFTKMYKLPSIAYIASYVKQNIKNFIKFLKLSKIHM